MDPPSLRITPDSVQRREESGFQVDLPSIGINLESIHRRTDSGLSVDSQSQRIAPGAVQREMTVAFQWTHHGN